MAQPTTAAVAKHSRTTRRDFHRQQSGAWSSRASPQSKVSRSRRRSESLARALQKAPVAAEHGGKPMATRRTMTRATAATQDLEALRHWHSQAHKVTAGV